MILDRLVNLGAYAEAVPGLQELLGDFELFQIFSIPEGRHELHNDACLIVSMSEAFARSNARLEGHRRFIDVHIVVAGLQEIGWRSTTACSVDVPYDPESDIVLFRDQPVL